MINRRRLSLAITVVGCLLVVSSAASADPLDTFTASSVPTHVKPSTSVSYTIKLTTNPSAPDTAQRAKIAIPSGFTVTPASVQASTSAAGSCTAATWEADGALIANAKINLKRPGGNNTALCPGATLTVVFLAASAAADGAYIWTSELLNDATGAFTLSGAQPSVVVDGTVPIVTITQKPSNPTNSTSASFAFTSTEALPLECKLDAAAFAPCASPNAYTALAAGAHAFLVRATDAAGNVGEASYSWTIDTTAPAVTITASPPNPSNDTSPNFGFTANETSTVQCQIDGGGFAACSSGQGYNLAAGTHNFVVRAIDAAGNVGVASYAWTIDTTAPTTSIIGKPNNPSNIESPSFAFTATESATFECKLDGAAFAPCASPKGYTALADGAHTFRVNARDTAGNAGPEAPYTWTIDTIVPTASITLKPSSPSSTSSPTFAFIASESSSFSCRLDGGGFAPCTSPTSYSNLADGPHTFATRATDPAGNTSPEASHTWTIETRAPTAALTSAPSPLSNSSAATFAFSADEPSSFECALDGRGFEQCGSPATYHGLGDGQHTFNVRARDAVGNFSPAVSHSWAIDTTAPETTLASGPKPVTTDTSATFTFSASESGSFECRLDGAPFALCGSPKSYSGLAKGDHRFEVRAIDAAGNADGTPALHPWKIQAPVRKIATSALLAPRSGARVTKPPLLVWRRAARAGYYNVQLFRGKRKILSAWPTRARLRLSARWKFAGRVRRLTPGVYRWYVWPGYGVPSARNYGQLLGQSMFVVARSARR
jgi:large repetitive protein